METSFLGVLVNGIASFLDSKLFRTLGSELILKYYKKEEEILKLLKPILESITNTDFASDKMLLEIFEELNEAMHELSELFEIWQLMCSKIYIVRLKYITTFYFNYCLL